MAPLASSLPPHETTLSRGDMQVFRPQACADMQLTGYDMQGMQLSRHAWGGWLCPSNREIREGEVLPWWERKDAEE